MSDKKICPLSFSSPKDYDLCECKEKKCAWWDDFTGHCAILSISRHGAKGSFGIVQEERGK